MLDSRPLVNCAVKPTNFKIKQDNIEDEKDIATFRTLYLSVDPYMRCRFNETTGVDYTKPFEIGKPITSAAIVEVLNSTPHLEKEYGFKKGAILLDFFDSWPWQDIVLENDLKTDHIKQLKKLPDNSGLLFPVSLYLGTVGQTGVSAFFGILGELNPNEDFEKVEKVEDLAKPDENDIILVSGAAGAVGSVVGQLSKLKKAKVIGICGSNEKGKVLIDQLGFDGFVNYKSKTLKEDMNEVLNNRKSSVYFDNVGGNLSNLIISEFLEDEAKVIICGQIDSYNSDEEYPPKLPKDIIEVISKKRIERERYLVFKYEKYFEKSMKLLANLTAKGQLKSLETKQFGIEKAPEAFCDMMDGKNTGKMIVQCVNEKQQRRE